MSDHEDERRVKARYDLDSSGQHYRKTYKRTVSKKKLPRAGMTIEGAQNSSGQEESSDEDVEDETYVASPKAPHHSKGKGLASGSRSGALYTYCICTVCHSAALFATSPGAIRPPPLGRLELYREQECSYL
jgi:hypothetical protein